jgi:hypothetical protein
MEECMYSQGEYIYHQNDQDNLRKPINKQKKHQIIF